MPIGALCISRRLWRITIGLSLPELSSQTCTATCRFRPRVLVCFCLLTLGPSSGGALGRNVLCTLDFAAPTLANASAASLYTSLLCPCTCIMDIATVLPCNNWYMPSHISWCPIGCLPFATHPRRLHNSTLLKISTHHLESLYRHNSWLLRTARIPTLTADTSTLLFVYGPTPGSLMLSYSTWGKRPGIPLVPRSPTHPPACIFVESNINSGTDSSSNNCVCVCPNCPRDVCVCVCVWCVWCVWCVYCVCCGVCVCVCVHAGVWVCVVCAHAYEDHANPNVCGIFFALGVLKLFMQKFCNNTQNRGNLFCFCNVFSAEASFVELSLVFFSSLARDYDSFILVPLKRTWGTLDSGGASDDSGLPAWAAQLPAS